MLTKFSFYLTVMFSIFFIQDTYASSDTDILLNTAKNSLFFKYGNFEIININKNTYVLSVAMAQLKNKKGCILKARTLSDKQLNKFINDVTISTSSGIQSKYTFVQEGTDLKSIATESYYEKIIENCKGRVYDSFTVGSWFDDDGLTCYHSNAILLHQ